MLLRCACKNPPFYYQDYEIVSLGEDGQGEITLETCKTCGTFWLKYLIEDPHFSDSSRWWRAEVANNEISSISVGYAKEYIESQDQCFAGGSFYQEGIHKKYKPIYIK